MEASDILAAMPRRPYGARTNNQNMNIIEAIRICLFTKYFNFDDRGSRAEFWLFYLAVYLLEYVIDLIFELSLWTTAITLIPIFIPQIAAGARRLHDIGRSGWNQLWVFTIIGIPVVLWWLITPSDPGKNRYGNEPDR